MLAPVFAMYIESDRGNRVNWIKCPRSTSEPRRTQTRGRDRQYKLLVCEQNAWASDGKLERTYVVPICGGAIHGATSTEARNPI
jgi:hypothetical protein